MDQPTDTRRIERTAAVLRQVLPPASAISVEAQSLSIDGCPVPFEGGIARFRRDDGYNASFALQWARFRLNQYDHVNGTQLTADRYLRGTGWPRSGLEGELVLEAGCGAGRFTRILAETGATVVAFDFSRAVEVSADVNGDFPNIVFLQADVLNMPFREASFDRVFCHGVLQHTENPEAAFRALRRVIRPGGRLSIDIYHRDGKIQPWKSKYLWRPLTTRISPPRLLAFLEWFIPRWLPFDTAIKRIPGIRRYLGAIIPCWNYFNTPLSREQKLNWAVMDTFDALAPRYDQPATLAEVEGWFRTSGFRTFEVKEGGNGILGNGEAA